MNNMGLITLEGYEDNNDIILDGYDNTDLVLEGIVLDGWFKKLTRKIKRKVKKTVRKVKKTAKKVSRKVKKTVKKTTSPLKKITHIVKKTVSPITKVVRNSPVYKTVSKINQQIAKNPLVKTAAITAATVYGGPAGAKAAKMALDQLSGKKINFKQLASMGNLSTAVNAIGIVNPEAMTKANELFATAKQIKDQYQATKKHIQNIQNIKTLTESEAKKKSALIEKYAKQLYSLNSMFDDQVQQGVKEAEKIEADYKKAVVSQYATKPEDIPHLEKVYDQVNNISNQAFVQQQASSFEIEPEYVYPGVIK